MADRVTKAMALKAFEVLAKECGKRIATSYKDAGAWHLDHAACYGGYVVVEQLGNGGETHPLGDERKSAKDFYHCAWYAVHAIEIAKAGAQ
jgi:hypothetical protein